MSITRLTMEVADDPIDGGYLAGMRELPGCVSQGDTEVEALMHLAEALQGVLGVMLDDGVKWLAAEYPDTVAVER